MAQKWMPGRSTPARRSRRRVASLIRRIRTASCVVAVNLIGVVLSDGVSGLGAPCSFPGSLWKLFDGLTGFLEPSASSGSQRQNHGNTRQGRAPQTRTKNHQTCINKNSSMNWTHWMTAETECPVWRSRPPQQHPDAARYGSVIPQSICLSYDEQTGSPASTAVPPQ